MTKQYKYIGNDPQKKDRVVKSIEDQENFYGLRRKDKENGMLFKRGDCRTTDYDKSMITDYYRALPKELIENEPTLRQEVKEDVFEKIWNDYDDGNETSCVKDLKKSIEKHIGMTKYDLHNLSKTYMTDCRYIELSKVEKLFSDRGLLIE